MQCNTSLILLFKFGALYMVWVTQDKVKLCTTVHVHTGMVKGWVINGSHGN